MNKLAADLSLQSSCMLSTLHVDVLSLTALNDINKTHLATFGLLIEYTTIITSKEESERPRWENMSEEQQRWSRRQWGGPRSSRTDCRVTWHHISALWVTGQH